MFRSSPRAGSNLLRLLRPHNTFGRKISPNPVSNNLHRLRGSPATNFQGRALSISTRCLAAKASSKPGEHARVDSSMHVSQPPDEEIPSTRLVQRQKRTLSSFSLEGKTAVVTGGARGLGYVMAQALVESGANVAIVDLNGEEAEDAASRLTTHIASTLDPSTPIPIVTSHACNVASASDVSSTFTDIAASHSGRIDILVTSAGICENHPAELYPPERMDHLWSINVNGTYYCAAELARHVKSRQDHHDTAAAALPHSESASESASRASDLGASIILIGSMSASIVNIPQPQAPYNASKAAVVHLARSFAVEWAPWKIRVNCISPGYMLTDLTRRILQERPELGEKWRSLVPAGELGVPEDLMGTVVYLASDASRYVTGTEVKVDGGYTAT